MIGEQAPRRVQLRRTKGWRMPENTVKVDRSTKWGNPYRAGIHCDHQHAVDLHRMALVAGKYRAMGDGGYYVTAEQVALHAIGVRSEIGQLRGKNLACWCEPGAPCHADVLLELANAPPLSSSTGER